MDRPAIEQQCEWCDRWMAEYRETGIGDLCGKRTDEKWERGGLDAR